MTPLNVMPIDDTGGDSTAGRQSGTVGHLIHPTDLRLSLLILVVCAYLYYLTTQFEQVAQMLAQDVTPQFFPRLLIWTIVVFALLMPFEHLHLARRNSDIDSHRRDGVKWVTYATAALLCALVAAIQWIGIWLVMSITCVSLPMLWGERRLKWLLPFAIVFPAVVALLFSQVLKVHLEPGKLWSAFFG